MSAEETSGQPRQFEAFEPLPGDLLRGGRERQAWTREQAARALNLDVATVIALEQNRFEDLGAPVFAKGHLLKYARVLDLDTEAVMRAYWAHVGVEATPDMPTSLAAPVEAAPGDEGRRGPWIAVLVLLGLVAAGVVLWRILANGQAPAPAPEGTEAVLTPSLTEMREAMPPPRREQAAGADGTAATPEAATAEAAAPEPAPAGPAVEGAEPVPGSAQLEVAFGGESWVEVRDESGERLLYELGRAGTTRRLTGQPPLRIVLGDASAVSLRLDGEAVPVPPEVRVGNRAAFEVWLENGEIVISREPGGE